MGQTESIYDSLDRRQHNRVILQSSLQSAQYDEPDKEQSVQPLMMHNDQPDQYYCGKCACFSLLSFFRSLWSVYIVVVLGQCCDALEGFLGILKNCDVHVPPDLSCKCMYLNPPKI